MSGGDARINIRIEADATAAAQELDDQFTRAITSALKSNAVRAAFTKLATDAATTFNTHFGSAVKTATQQMAAFQQANTTAAKTSNKEWDRVVKAIKKVEKGVKDLNKAQAATSSTAKTSAADWTKVVDAINKVENSVRKLTTAQGQVSQSAQLAAKARIATEERIKAQIEKTHGVTVANIQQETAFRLSADRRRLELLRQFGRQVVLVEKAIGAAFTKAAKVAEEAFRGLLRGVSSILSRIGSQISRVFSRSGTSGAADGLSSELGKRVGILRRIFGREKSVIQSELRGQTGLFRSAASEQSRVLDQMQRRQSRGLTGLATGRSSLATAFGIGGIAAGGAGLMSLFTSGFERASNLERLQAQFTAMLGSGEQAASLLERIDAFARKTPFDLVGVADSARAFLAMGQNADESLHSIEVLSDAIAFTGGTSENLDRVRIALQQIFSTGKLQGDEFNQLAENLGGINVRQIVADQLGVSVQDLTKMQEEGKLTADIFTEAFLTGLEEDPRIAGSAEALSKTLSGRLANLKESFAALGATFIGLIAGPLRTVFLLLNDLFGKLGDFISGENLTPQLERLREVLGDVAKGLGIAVAIKGFGEALRFLGIGLRAFLSPLGLLLAGIAALSVVFGKMVRASKPLQDALTALKTSFGDLFTSLRRLGTNIFNTIFGDGAEAAGAESAFTRLGDAAAGFVEKIQGAIDKVNEWVGLIADVFAPTPPARRGMENPFELLAQQDPNQLISSNLLPEVARERLLEGRDGLHEFTPMVSAADAAQIWEDFAPDWWQGSEEALAGETPAAKARTEILNRLEGTFFGPLVKQLRNPESGLRQAGSRIGDAFRSIGRAILAAWHWLEDHVGPIITAIGDFFAELIAVFTGGDGRNQADALGIGGFAGSSESSLGDRLYDFFLGDAGKLSGIIEFFSGIWDGVYNFLEPALQTAGDIMIWLSENVGPLVQPIVDGFKELFEVVSNGDWASLDLGNILMGAGIGAGAGFLAAGPIGGLIGGLIGGISQTSLGSGIAEAFTGGIAAAGRKIQPAIAALGGTIAGFLSDTFSSPNLINFGTFILNAAKGLGNAIGKVVTDPLFLAGVFGAGIAIIAAATALAGSFAIGFGEAMLDNIGQLGGYISDALVGAWESMKFLDFIPDPISDAITAVLGNPAIGIAIGLGVAGLGVKVISALAGAITTAGTSSKSSGFKFTTLGQTIAGSLFGAISRPFQQLWRGGLSLFTGKQFQGGIGQNSALGKSTFDSRGQVIGSALAAGLAAGFSGYATAQAGSPGGIILSLLGGAAAGAAIGSVFSPLGTAIGGVLGVAAAGIGAYFGAASRNAEEAKAKIDEFTEAIRTSGQAGLEQVAQTRFEGLEDTTRRLLEDMDFSVAALADRLIEGGSTIGDEVGLALEGISDVLFQGDTVGDLSIDQDVFDDLDRMIEIARAMGDEFDSQDFLFNLAENGIDFEGVTGALEEAGFSSQDLLAILNEVAGVGGDVKNSLDLIGDGAAIAGDDITTAADAAAELNAAFKGGITAQEINDILSQEGLTSAEAMEALGEAADTAAEAVEEARSAVSDFLGEFRQADEEEVARTFRINLPSVEEDIQRIAEEAGEGVTVPVAIEFDAGQQAVNEWGDRVADDLAGLIDSEQISTPEEFDAVVAQMNTDIATAIANGEISTTVGEALQAELAAIQTDTVLRGLLQNLGAAVTDEKVVNDALSSLTGDGGAGGGGAAGAATYAAGFESNGIAIRTAIQSTVSDAFDNAKYTGIDPAGSRLIESFATGAKNAPKNGLLSAGSQAATAVAQGVQYANIAMFVAGANLMNSFAAGIRSRAAAAAVAAASAAYAVIRATQIALGIRSPSKVFRSIGQDVGEGFALGIEDSQASMTQALTTAIDKVISDAQDTAKARSAQAAAAIFGALTPSTLPGGTSLVEQQRALLEQRLGVSEFRTSLRSGAAERLSSLGAGGSGFQARIGIGGAVQEFTLAFEDVNNQFRDAATASAELAKFQKDYNKLQADYASGALGEAEATRQRSEAWTDLSVAMRVAAGDTDAVTSAQESYNQTIRQINAELAEGVLNGDAYQAALSALGDRPDALDATQRNLLASGSTSLSSTTIAGRENLTAIDAAIGSIREWGQAALEAGSSAGSVVTTMQAYLTSLANQAAALGFNRAVIVDIIGQYGLSASALEQWRQGLVDLRTTTVEGITNRLDILSQLEGIRSFGEAALTAGASVTEAVTNMRTLRDQLITTATGFGFNATQLATLIEMVGLSDAALADFVLQMQEFEAAATAAADATNSGDRLDRPNLEANITIMPPYGDPEAIGLSVANRLAYSIG